MDRLPQPQRSHLFTVRLWVEVLGQDQTEWRGEVRHVLSEKARYFRDWATMIAFLEQALHELDPATRGEPLPDEGRDR